MDRCSLANLKCNSATNPEPRASLVQEPLARNLKIADELGRLTADNGEKLTDRKARFPLRGGAELGSL